MSLKSPGHRGEQAIAGKMPQAIVDVLETVQVEQEDSAARTPRNGVGQLIHEQEAVRQVAQRGGGTLGVPLEQADDGRDDGQYGGHHEDEPEAVQAEILGINTDARNLSLQVALLVSVIASLLGLLNSFRMKRLPDIAPSASIEGVTLG